MRFAFAIVVVLVACGPSLRMMHRSATFYEQCYAIDADPAEPVARKGDCWSDWLQDYAAAQPPERVRFARERRDALRSGASSGIDTSPASRQASEAMRALVTHPDAGVADAQSPIVDAGRSRDAAPDAPPSPCHSDCTARWNACIGVCTGDLDSCRAACRAERRICTHACE